MKNEADKKFSRRPATELLRGTETYMICINIVYVARNEISAGFDKRQRFSPWTPIVKITYFGNVMSIDTTLPKRAIFTMGVYGEIILSDPAVISFLTT